MALSRRRSRLTENAVSSAMTLDANIRAIRAHLPAMMCANITKLQSIELNH